MNEFKEFLNPDEEILWTGSPEETKALDPLYKSKYLIKAVITVALAVLILWLLISKNTLNTLVVIVVAAVSAWVLYAPFNDARKAKSMSYAVTNQRILTHISSGLKSVTFESIKMAKIVKDSDGHTSFLFGEEAVTLKPTQFRNIAILGPKTSADLSNCERFVMFAVKDPQQLKDVLAKYIAI